MHCGQTVGRMKTKLGVPVGLGPDHIVLDGIQFSAHVYCGQTAAWIKMPLGTVVDLSLHDIVFDVDPATPRKKAHPPPPIFWPMRIVAKWLDG